MLKMKNILLISLILIVFSCLGRCFAAENNTIIVDTEEGNIVAKVDGKEYNEYCLNQSKDLPKKDRYTISKDTSDVPDTVQKIVVKYFRKDSSERQKRLIQYAIWGYLDGIESIRSYTNASELKMIQQMLSDQTGVVDNTYTDENGKKYIFDLRVGTPPNLYLQNVLFFRYDIENATEEPTPSIETDAKNNNTGDRNGKSDGIVTITDKVKYKNLKTGQEYTVTGYLMYKNGTYVTINGQKINVTKTFTPNSTDGFIELEFTFNATGLGNVSLVVFEYLTDSNGTEIANHTDLNDPNQTITFTEPPTDPEEPSNPDEPGTPDEPDEPDEPDFPDLPFFPDFPDYPDEPDEPDEQNNPKLNIPKTSAEMKPTGMPIIAIILVLLASLGLINRKK